METALGYLAPYLARMSDGETGDRHLWVTPAIDSFRANPDVEMVHDGNWTDYDDTARWRVREGVTLDPDNIRLHYKLSFERSFPAFRELRGRFGRGDLRFQVGIPAPIDLALYTFGDVVFSDASILNACTLATAREINKIFAIGGEEVVFQIETVVALVGVAQAPTEQQAAVAKQMADAIIGLVALASERSHFGLHLCLGDFHHKAYGKMRDVGPMVQLANAIIDGWPDGRTLDYLHAPFAAAAEPPIADEAFYTPLEQLRLPEQVRFVAGFLHEDLDLPAHQQLLARIEGLLGREVDIAAACGLGRRDTNEEAFDQMRETAALIESRTD